MKIAILGGGPAGLYCGLLLKRAKPDHDVEVLERNAPGATYGWGVVFSDRTLSAFQEADPATYRAIQERFVLWDTIDVRSRGATVRCGGHVFAGLARKELLGLLQERCAQLGVALRFRTEIADLKDLGGYDLLIAADGINSVVRAAHAEHFRPELVAGRARYIWLGADHVLDAFTFIFKEHEAGFFQVHAYPFSGATSTVIVECGEETWRRAGLEAADEAQSIAFCEQLFVAELGGCRLRSNNSRWITFTTVTCARWSHGNVVLLGDAAHTAHFSIGSGTKLAMEDAIALADALAAHEDVPSALRAYEAQRRPVVEAFQAAAAESQTYFEHVDRYRRLPPIQFAFNLLTRSGRISYDDLHLRDPYFGARVDRHFTLQHQPPEPGDRGPLYLPPPAFAPLRLRRLALPNRIVFAARDHWQSWDTSSGMGYCDELITAATEGAGLVLSGPVAVSAEARISPGCACLDEDNQHVAWEQTVDSIHACSTARVGIVLNHAGRRGATQSRRTGLDRPLREGAWPLLAPSALPYAALSRPPRAMDRADMDRVRDDFVRATRLAAATGADLLLLHMGHGYLLASFLSPLGNQRQDEYGGALENRMRFPLEVFRAVRAAWPTDRPLAVALNITDCHRAGQSEEEGIAVARALREQGCDLLMVLAGQTTPACEPAYGRGFLTPLADRVRNEVGIPVLVGGYLTTANEANTVLVGGRADLCLLTPDDRLRGEAIPETRDWWEGTAGERATAAAPITASRPQSQADRPQSKARNLSPSPAPEDLSQDAAVAGHVPDAGVDWVPAPDGAAVARD